MLPGHALGLGVSVFVHVLAATALLGGELPATSGRPDASPLRLAISAFAAKRPPVSAPARATPPVAPAPIPVPDPAPAPAPIDEPARPPPVQRVAQVSARPPPVREAAAPVRSRHNADPPATHSPPAPSAVVRASASSDRPAPAAVQTADRAGQGDTERAALAADYLAELRAAIEANKRYPRKARRMRREGRVEMGFTVHAAGRLSDVRVVRSSGYPALDTAAAAAVSDSAPFRPIPPALGRASWEVVIALVYRLR
jgi:protein TonB